MLFCCHSIIRCSCIARSAIKVIFSFFLAAAFEISRKSGHASGRWKSRSNASQHCTPGSAASETRMLGKESALGGQRETKCRGERHRVASGLNDV
jgi:hypothetical protein